MTTTKPIKDKPLAPAPKLKPRPTAASIARAALNANRLPPPLQQRSAAKSPSSPVAKRKQYVRRSSPENDAKAETDTDTKIQEMVTNVDPKPDDINMDLEEKLEEPVHHQDRSAVLEDLQEELQLETDVPVDYSEPVIDSIDITSTPSISQPQTPVASRPQTPKSATRTQPSAAGTRPNTPHSALGSARPTTPVSRPPTPRILAQPSSIPHSVPQEPVTSNDVSEMDDDDIKSVYSAKQKQFLKMKKELDMKQQAVLEAFDSLRALRERMPEAVSGGGEGAAQELLVFNVADWPAEELSQLYRDVASTDTDGAMQLIESIPVDEFNFNEVEAKVVKIPEQFAELCLQAFTARQELVDWIKDLLLHSNNPQDCGEGETLQRIAHYNSQGLQLCDALRELKDRADSAVDSVSYLSKRVWRDQNALISVGKELVRDVARLKQDLETQAGVINEMQHCRLQTDDTSLGEIRQELEEERAAKNELKEKLALSENQHRKTRMRVTKMDRQLREAEASIATLTGTVKVLEDQSRQREAQLEARARKMRESLKTGEVASGHLAQKRDALQAEVTELKDQMEKLTAQYNSTIKKLENQLKETKSALEAQTQLIHKKDMELATAREATLAESKATIEQLTARITELENNTTHNDDQKLTNAREMELVAQLQATKESLRSLEEEVIVYKQEKVRFLETLSKIANTDDKVRMQQKLAAELLSKEEIIGKMQVQMRDLTRNDKLLEQKVVQYEQYINDLQAQSTGGNNLENSNEQSFQEYQKEILDLKMKLLEEAHRNEELAEALAQKEHQLEQQDKTSRAQARVIKVREELINMLKNKETEQTRELLALQRDLENRMSIVDEVNKQIAAKALEIQELFATLETKQQQIHRLEKIVLALEEQQRRAQAQRTRHEEKIATLERELAASCRRERSRRMVNMPDGHVDADRDVVLTGLSGRLPECGSVQEFERQLFAGADFITADDRRWPPGIHGLPARSGKLKDLAYFDAMFFGVHAKQAQLMDPQLRLLLEVAHEAMVDAGLNPVELRGSRTGVYAGVMKSDSYNAWCEEKDKINGYAWIGCSSSMFANRVSFAFDFKGPSIAIDTACSSSMCAFVQAVNDIRAGRCDSALVTSTNLCLDPTTSLNYHRLTMLSPEGRCASFDASANGFVRSEAVVAVLLQRRRDARRVYCTVRGAGLNNDGYKEQGIICPAGLTQRRLIQETFEEMRLQLQDVVYMEAHCAGTKVGDPIEVKAIAEVFCKERKTPLLVGSVKSNMGHAEVASGLCSIVKIVLAMERGIIPGNLHFKKPNPDITALNNGSIKVVDKNTVWQGGLVAVNSFGMGGTNAHVILEGGRGARPLPAEYPVPRLVLASGRTDDAVKQLLKLAAKHPYDAELHALIDAVHARAIHGHPRRGYVVLDATCSSPPAIRVLKTETEPRPICFMFSGMGSQWAGAARTLLHLPTFAASVARCAVALEPYGVDLQYVIAEAPAAVFEDIINCFVGITAMQVALVDVLRELDVYPDIIIGHSLGEIACAYADGALTAEQTVLCAYWRGRCTLDARPGPGAMAAVGLGWDEAARRCPKDIELACHNSRTHVTISGPLTSVEEFVEQLAADGVFVRMVHTTGIAFHSKYVADIVPPLLARLQLVIPEPKKRSGRWLSSSVPLDKWGSDIARFYDAAYDVNNFKSQVLFASALEQVPAHALVLEVAPHALMQAILKQTLPHAVHVPLLRRGEQDALAHLLDAVGKTYATGAQPQVSRLYPSVSWPVSRGTPGLASHVGWDHSVEWDVPDFKTAGRVGENTIEYDLRNPDDAFIAGHNIDGRVLFPAAGYVTLVWRTVAKINKLDEEHTAVVLENLRFVRATIVPRDGPLRFLVSLLGGTGEFEICEGGEVVVTGTARLANDPVAERYSASALYEDDVIQDDLPPLDSEDIYKELRLRGYHFNGIFRGIKSSNARGTHGLLKWDGNWISYMDTIMQYSLIGINKRVLYLPTRIERIVIDPTAQREAVAAAGATDDVVSVQLYRCLNVIVAGGVEIRGIQTTPASRSTNARSSPKLEKYVFLPLNGAEDTGRSKRDALTATLQLALENLNVLKLKLTEPSLQRSADELLLPHAMQVLEAEPSVRVEATLAAGADAPFYADAMGPLQIKVSSKEVADGGLETGCDLALGADVLARPAGVLAALAAATRAQGFVLLDEPAHKVDDPDLLSTAGLTLVSRARAKSREYVLLRRAVVLPAAKVVVEVTEDEDCGWVERLKDVMKRAEREDTRVYVWSRSPGSGVQGLATCLRREPGADHLRLYYLPEAQHAFDPAAAPYKTQVQLDLAFNVLRASVWGTFRHLLLDDVDSAPVQMGHAFVNMLTRGDLSSLRWIESDLRCAAAVSRPTRTSLCHVYYSALNFHDIMLATSKLPADSHHGDFAEKECEYSGRLSTSKRVMGIVAAKGIATTVLANEPFMWEVPKQWSLEEAATVPAAYATAYYALAVRGRMRRGDAVLVHAGAGGVGQAAITIALHAGCTVFTTVGTPEKHAFLRERFPQIPEANIGNSRDCSFELLVLRRTRGLGVDLVLNSLAGDKLHASLRCLGKGGRFLEIGKVDISANTALGMAVLLKNATVHGVLLDELLNLGDDHPDKMETVRCVTEGIAAGAVRPLPASVFKDSQLEQAFRYMATGKHIGKVLIRVREESGDSTHLIPAIPRVYMHPRKSYVLVGGLGGMGLELGAWLVGRGARTLVLNTRTGVRTGYQAWCIRRWRAAGVCVVVSTADATTAAGARALLLEAAARAPVGGVFNLAFELRKAFFENQTPGDFEAVAKPKVYATRALDIASRELAPELEYFVVFSSETCGRGNPGLSSYGFANSGMERLCEQRRAAGLPALAVQWGIVGDVGQVARLGKEEVVGLKAQPIASCLAALDALMPLPYAVVASMVLADKRRAQEEPSQNLVQAIANILGIKDLKKVPGSATLTDMGMDSLMGTEIKQTLERGYDVLLTAQEIHALTFRKLRTMADKPTAPTHAAN